MLRLPLSRTHTTRVVVAVRSCSEGVAARSEEPAASPSFTTLSLSRRKSSSKPVVTVVKAVKQEYDNSSSDLQIQ